MRGALCVAATLVAAALGVGAQTDTKATQPATSVAVSTENLPASNDKTTPTKEAHDHNWHVRLGTIGLGVGYFHGPEFYPYGRYGFYPFYSAALWEPFWPPVWEPYYPAYVPSFGYASGRGEVKLTGAPTNAKVYVDSAYAGTADRLKHLWLDPGAYDLAVSAPGSEPFQQRIYVLSGKTLRISAYQAPNTLEKEKP